jgi:uncharacterized membrane protein YuzA (DUF378 family)
MESKMKIAHLTTLVLLIVGGLNWGLVGLLEWNLVAALFGPGSLVSRAVYVLVGLSALWHLGALLIAPSSLELTTGRGHPVR